MARSIRRPRPCHHGCTCASDPDALRYSRCNRGHSWPSPTFASTRWHRRAAGNATSIPTRRLASGALPEGARRPVARSMRSPITTRTVYCAILPRWPASGLAHSPRVGRRLDLLHRAERPIRPWARREGPQATPPGRDGEFRDATKFPPEPSRSHALPRPARRDGATSPVADCRGRCWRPASHLLELTHIRIGNGEYTRTKWLVRVDDPAPASPRADPGCLAALSLSRQVRAAARTASQRRRLAPSSASVPDLPGQELFQYVAEDGAGHAIGYRRCQRVHHAHCRRRVLGEGLPYVGRDHARHAGSVRASPRKQERLAKDVARLRERSGLASATRRCASAAMSPPSWKRIGSEFSTEKTGAASPRKPCAACSCVELSAPTRIHGS